MSYTSYKWVHCLQLTTMFANILSLRFHSVYSHFSSNGLQIQFIYCTIIDDIEFVVHDCSSSSSTCVVREGDENAATDEELEVRARVFFSFFYLSPLFTLFRSLRACASHD